MVGARVAPRVRIQLVQEHVVRGVGLSVRAEPPQAQEHVRDARLVILVSLEPSLELVARDRVEGDASDAAVPALVVGAPGADVVRVVDRGPVVRRVLELPEVDLAPVGLVGLLVQEQAAAEVLRDDGHAGEIPVHEVGGAVVVMVAVRVVELQGVVNRVARPRVAAEADLEDVEPEELGELLREFVVAARVGERRGLDAPVAEADVEVAGGDSYLAASGQGRIAVPDAVLGRGIGRIRAWDRSRDRQSESVEPAVLEDVARDPAEPAEDAEVAEVERLALVDREDRETHDVVERVVPDREHVLAGGHVRDRERSVRVPPRRVDLLAPAAVGGERDPGPDHWLGESAVGRPGRELDQRPRPAGDGRRPGRVVGRTAVVHVAEGASLDEAEPECGRKRQRPKAALAYCAEAVVALRQVGEVDVVLALEGRRLDPARPVGRDRERGVAARRQVLDRDLACRVREATGAGDDVAGRELAAGITVVHGADRVVVVVDDHLADPVFKHDLEAGHALGLLLRDVRSGVHRPGVGEDAHLQRRQRERVRDQLDHDRAGVRVRHEGDELAPHLVALRANRDEVPACFRLARRALERDRDRCGSCPSTHVHDRAVARHGTLAGMQVGID